MSWLQPLVWFGIVAIALPVLIHLLGLGRARRLPFPTLRFLQTTRLLPTRRTQLHDPLLLLVRAAIVLLAVAALAQPVWQTSERRSAYAESLARVIVLDTSRSARAAAQRSSLSVDSMQAIVTRLSREANVSIVLETARPAGAIAGAIEWLQLQPQRRELVLVSDFQRGSVSEAQWQAIPADIGVRLQRVEAASSPPPNVQLRAFTASGTAAVTSAFGNDAEQLRTRAEWLRDNAQVADSAPFPSVSVLAGADEDDIAMAILAAAAGAQSRLADSESAAGGATSRGAVDSVADARRVVIVAPSHESREAMQRDAVQPSAVWMLDVLAAINSNALLREVAADDEPLGGDEALIPVMRSSAGRIVVSAAALTRGGFEELVLFSHVALDNAATAALVAAAQDALHTTLDTQQLEITRANFAESEVLAIPDSVLTRWQREPSASGVAAATPPASRHDQSSDGRWLWLLVLLLLGVESVMRRSARPDTSGIGTRA